MKKLVLLICVTCLSVTFAKAQACGWGHGQIAVFNQKNKPIKKFKITFYELQGFDFTNKTKVTRVEYQANGWDIYLTKTEAEDFIKGKEPFSYEWDSDKKIVYYEGNIYNYRTIENSGKTVLAKISAKRYENYYFISPVFRGCSYYNRITLKKK
jgi:hypothetical protein